MSNKNNNVVVNGGVSFSGLLTVALIVLKLTHIIDWSWWWVTIFVWLPMAVFITLGIIGVITLMFIKRNK